ncbi:hypothetical protein K0B96_05060 [Horticoccus luteus]|uniref:YtkA-like domain-containing protein n=1 Tax=Horticoccus luteus TaxID=2862869 RepID=A0A8F9XMF6_9BACT|nr:hypothetical protein [Horticoccus luteus]QYM79989.1 hypothetical protein K0B96_05060 [Horticoccus luteus]
MAILTRSLDGAAWRQIGLLSLGAVAVFVGFRLLPTGTNLSHADFQVPGGNSIEFCDPANPQFIPVVAVRSPVTLTLTTAEKPMAGKTVDASVVLRTAEGKIIEPVDLLVAHTRKLHLMVIDPSLTDYQHVHPESGPKGEWNFQFTPRYAGLYRIFADFTPAATSRGLYANVDVAVGGHAPVASPPPPGLWQASVDGYAFRLTPAKLPIVAREVVDLKLTITREDGRPVDLEPIMDAFAHLVAFNDTRSGFAHLHPKETDLSKPPDAMHPTLTFRIKIPESGRYVIWAQIIAGGQQRFAPFWFDVQP